MPSALVTLLLSAALSAPAHAAPPLPDPDPGVGAVEGDPVEGEGAADPAAAGPAGALAPEDQVYRALSVRHPSPDCATVEAMTPTPVPTLLRMVDEAQQPPWVPMRAAECLLRRHPAEVADRLEQWVVDPELAGLGILVLNHLELLPPDQARDLATRAVTEGPDPEGARTRLQRLNDPDLRAIGAPAEVSP